MRFMPIKQSSNSRGAWLPLVLSLVLVVGFLAGLKTGRDGGTDLISIQSNKSKASYKVDEVLGFISQRYVDSVDVDALAESAIRMIVDSLDPHSMYMNAELVEEYQSRMAGHYVGLGIEYKLLRDTLVVTDVLENSPAMKAGLLRGDQLIQIDADTISGVKRSSQSVMDVMKGEASSMAKIRFRRCKESKETDLERGRVSTKSVPFAIPLDDETVFVMIRQFNANTAKEFLDVLEPFHESNQLKHLVIDLRGNPGGYLQEAVKLLNQFFDKKGEVLVYTEGINSQRTEYKTQGKSYLDVDELYVLIDEESASASEIIAGAIQDLDRGVIIGRRSFGKGLVQEQYELSHGGNLKLTVAKYYTPSGRLIQKRYDDNRAYDDEFITRRESGEWLDPSAIPLLDTTTYTTANGRIMRGSRGIVPDVFVPIDSSYLASNAYEMFVLKEEIAFDLYSYGQCGGVTNDFIATSLREPYWKEYLRNKTSLDNFGRLQQVDKQAEGLFVNDVIALLGRYEAGVEGFYSEDVLNDPYIRQVRRLQSTSEGGYDEIMLKRPQLSEK